MAANAELGGRGAGFSVGSDRVDAGTASPVRRSQKAAAPMATAIAIRIASRAMLRRSPTSQFYLPSARRERVIAGDDLRRLSSEIPDPGSPSIHARVDG